MKDDSLDSAPEGAPEGESKVYVNLASLATEDGTMPEMGDEVEFTVTGSVQSLEGEVACVTPTAINGEPAPNASAAEPMDPRAQMEADARQEDGGYY